MARYCVLWIPTIFHKKLSLLEDRPNAVDVNLCDIPELEYRVTVTLDCNGNVDITPIAEGDDRIVRLTFIKSTFNGLFLYKYEESTQPEVTSLLGEGIPFVIYNTIKGFYHKHQYRNGEEDAFLKPYVIESQSEPDINSSTNDALVHYLENFEGGFQAWLNVFQRAYDDVKARKWSINAYEGLVDMTYKIKGEELYCKSLGRSVNYMPDAVDCDKPNVSQIEFNIGNVLACIKHLESKALNEFGFKNATTSFRIALWALGFSILLGITSVILSVFGLLKC